MKNLVGKKASHVGIVLSFIVFVTFVIFIFSVLEPRLRINLDKESLLDNIKIKFLDEVSAELSTIGIFINSAPGSGCELLLMSLEKVSGFDAVVKDNNGYIVGSKTQSESLLKIDWNQADNFYKVYSSEENLYDYSFPSGTFCVVTDFKISSTRDDKYVFEKKLTEFITANNFDSLNIPDGTGFDVMFEDADGNNLEGVGKEPPGSISVYSDRFSIQYFDDNADIKTGFITIRIW